MKNLERDRAIWAVTEAVRQLIKDGILAVYDEGLMLTPLGDALFDMRDKYRKEHKSKGEVYRTICID